MDLKRSRPLLSIIAAVGLAAAFGPAPAGADEPVELAAVTTITGSGPASALVTLPVDAAISATTADNKDISIEGEGRYIGVVLVEDTDEERLGPFIMAGRVDPQAICDEGGCPYGVATPVIGGGIEFASGDFIIPAGTYRLHLVTEPSPGPVSVTLRFGGLTGEAELTPQDPTGVRTLPLPPNPSLPESQSLYWNGGVHDMGSLNRGVMWSLAWLRQPVQPQGRFHYCMYMDSTPEDAPGCPTADVDVGITHGIVGPVKLWMIMEGVGYPVQGNFGQKLWFAADVADRVDGLAIWLPFGEVPGGLPGTSGLLRLNVFPVAISPNEATSEPVTVVRCQPAPCSGALSAV